MQTWADRVEERINPDKNYNAHSSQESEWKF